MHDEQLTEMLAWSQDHPEPRECQHEKFRWMVIVGLNRYECIGCHKTKPELFDDLRAENERLKRQDSFCSISNHDIEGKAVCRECYDAEVTAANEAKERAGAALGRLVADNERRGMTGAALSRARFVLRKAALDAGGKG